MAEFLFKILKKDKKSRARLGLIKTRNGTIETPYFVPVATAATVKSLDSDDLDDLGAQCTLANTYHLHLRPTDKIIKKVGGLHKFMSFNKPIFTDSGGFQAFSLGVGMDESVGKMGSFENKKNAKNNAQNNNNKVSTNQSAQKNYNTNVHVNPNSQNFAKVDDHGVHFRSVYDGTPHFMDAKVSMEIQKNLGSDIIMAFDECTSPNSDYNYTKKALERTKAWAKLSLKYHDKKQALYGIIQGNSFEDLRLESTKFTNSLPFDGIAIGGSFGDAYGDSKQTMHKVLDWVIPHCDENKPRHMLGIGVVDDIFECVERGIDTFDCVNPTRVARRGNLFIHPKSGGRKNNSFRINIKNAKFKTDKTPIDKNCTCSTCKRYSKAYLRHLYVNGEIAYFKLAAKHNIHYMLRLMEEIRESLKNDSFQKLKKQWLK